MAGLATHLSPPSLPPPLSPMPPFSPLPPFSPMPPFVPPAFPAVLSNAVINHCDEEDALGEFGPVLGVLMGLTGSVGINSGQNMQANALQASEAVRLKPTSSKAWKLGMTVFIIGSLINFAAFTFASASILVPLEAVQFVTNVVYARFINKQTITRRTYIGTALAIVGTVFAVRWQAHRTRP